MNEQLSFAGFENHVISSRFSEDLDRDWEKTYSDFLDAESLEMLMQHGNGMLLLMPLPPEAEQSFWPDAEEKRALQYGMADEMGDVLWFSFDVAKRNNIDISEACLKSLEKMHITVPAPIEKFADIEKYAMANASEIKVLNKAALLGLDVPDDRKYTSLEQNPQYLLIRTARRLSRSLDKGSKDLAPFTASELEPPVDLQQALGEYLLVLAYVAREKLDVSLEHIAQFNVAKLAHRQQFGKSFDIKFAAWIHSVEQRS